MVELTFREQQNPVMEVLNIPITLSESFFEMAKKQSWYNNTVFVIVADHCASSAGKTELPMDKYRIPAMVYVPDGSVQPQQFGKLMSQIDLMPTVFGLFKFQLYFKISGTGCSEASLYTQSLYRYLSGSGLY